jgi:hypothetical protein
MNLTRRTRVSYDGFDRDFISITFYSRTRCSEEREKGQDIYGHAAQA